jgi:hypothetical protein
MGVSDIVRRLSHAQREALIEHAAGPRPIDCQTDGGMYRRTCEILRSQRLIGPVSTNIIAPTHYVLTEVGREVACAILSECIEHLVKGELLAKTLPEHAKLVPSREEIRMIEALSPELTVL